MKLLPQLLLLLVSLSAVGQELAHRKSIDTLSAEELENFIHALKILRARPANRIDSYRTFERLHNGGTLPNGKQGGCVHGDGDFLPWHRMLLAQFEDALQKSDPARTANVALPYWDFTKPATGKRFPIAFEDDESPLWHANRSNLTENSTQAEIAFAAQVEETRKILTDSDRLESTLFGLTRYRQNNIEPGFSNALENGIHNWIHAGYCYDSDMDVDTNAAKDAIFWSFHCYVDLAWYRWQMRNGAFANAAPELLPADLAQEYDHFPVPMTVGEVLDPKSAALGYDFVMDSDAPLPPPANVLAGEKLVPLEGATMKFNWRGALTDKKQEEAVSAGKKPLATLSVKGAKGPADGSWMVEFYLHPKDVAADFGNIEFKKKYLAADYVQWKGTHHPHHEDQEGKNLLLPLAAPPLAASLEPGGEFILSVNYVSLSPGKQAANPEAKIEAGKFICESISVTFR